MGWGNLGLRQGANDADPEVAGGAKAATNRGHDE